MNRGERRRESKLGRAQSIDIEGIRNNNPQALQAALGAIETNVRQQRYTKARKLCDNALAANPSSSQLNHALGVVLQTKGDFARAAEAFQKAVSLKPDYLAAWVNLGICARAMKDTDTALRASEKAIAIDPASFHAHYNLGLVYCDLKRMDDAVAALNRSLEILPNSPEARFQIGFLYELQQDHAQAITHYREALAANSASDLLHTHLGSCLQMIGRFKEGAEHLKEAIRLNPANGRAHLALASSQQAETDAGFTAGVRAQARRRDIPSKERINLNFAAARLLERTCNYDEAFGHYKTGNELRNATSQFDREQFLGLHERIARVFNETFFARLSGAGEASERPVFVVGIPRSGTTLVEQIIASHPRAFGAGELANLPEICSLSGRFDSTAYPDCMAELTAQDISDMAARYLAAYPPASAGADKVVDKTPGNALWVGMIAAMFPNAAIIHCDRDAMDTLWSCYTQNFHAHVFYSFDLENLAAYHALHTRAMQHWEKVLPGRVINVCYEELVADPEPAIRRVIAACGLEWDDRCLEFHTFDRSVTTTSLWQVRRPVFKSSIGKWRNFEPHLGPLKTAMERYGALRSAP